MRWFGWTNVWLAVALTLVRGVPVLFDAVPYMRHGGKTAIAEPLAAPVPVARAPTRDDPRVAVVPVTAAAERRPGNACRSPMQRILRRPSERYRRERPRQLRYRLAIGIAEVVSRIVGSRTGCATASPIGPVTSGSG